MDAVEQRAGGDRVRAAGCGDAGADGVAVNENRNGAVGDGGAGERRRVVKSNVVGGDV